jgi:pimeloyl-ACP methyl ester carboxylesterase
LRFPPRCSLLLAVVVGLASGAQAAVADSSPRLVLADCRLDDAEHLRSLSAQCAELEVAEDRAAPSSPRIRLKVAVIPALDRSGPHDPLFVLAGGPGQAATEFYVSAAPGFARVQRERDIVLVDQRGTGRSNALECEYPEEDELADMSPAEIRRLTRDCLAALKSDPRHYTTSVAVRDLDEVRAALGYDRINLYGVSYGTRVAQHYLRRFPDRVRAVILDGVVPMGLALVADSALQAQRALDLIFERCGADAECHSAFPNPAGAFAAVRARLTRQPAVVSMPEPVTGKSPVNDSRDSSADRHAFSELRARACRAPAAAAERGSGTRQPGTAGRPGRTSGHALCQRAQHRHAQCSRLHRGCPVDRSQAHRSARAREELPRYAAARRSDRDLQGLAARHDRPRLPRPAPLRCSGAAPVR